MAGRHPKPRGTTTQLGYWAAKKALQRFSTHVIDGRSRVAKALDAFRDELVADLGGPENVSRQQYTIINLALKTNLLLESVDAYILKMDSLVHKRRRALYPIVRERQNLADSLARYMQMLGLAKRAKPVSSLFTVPWADSKSEASTDEKVSDGATAEDSAEQVEAQDR
jgi:hypothetical protein